MRIDRISLKNFRGFEEFETTLDPNFTLFVGENGAGKTSIIEALSVTCAFFLKRTGVVSVVGMNADDERKEAIEDGETFFFKSHPITIKSTAQLGEQSIEFIHDEESRSQKPLPITPLPEDGIWPILLRRSCLDSPPATGVLLPENKTEGHPLKDHEPYREAGYKDWWNPNHNPREFQNWLGTQAWISWSEKKETSHLRIAKNAILEALHGAKDIWFDPRVRQVVVRWENGLVAKFSNLSDGQKSILALVGDIARRCSLLNPQLGEDVIKETSGIVLIDEIDMHLHPRWQRRIVGDLKRIFPKIQFVATSHSPFIIQSLDPGELRIVGEGEASTFEYWEQGIEDITEHVMGVDQPQRSERYGNMLSAAEEYFRLLHAEDTPPETLAAARERVLKQSVDHPGDPVIATMLKDRELRKEAKAK